MWHFEICENWFKSLKSVTRQQSLVFAICCAKQRVCNCVLCQYTDIYTHQGSAIKTIGTVGTHNKEHKCILFRFIYVFRNERPNYHCMVLKF
jgi:hypothetical protein